MKLMMGLCMVGIVLQLFGSPSAANPFLGDWDTPFGVPPFDKIELEHYTPAFEEGMLRHKQQIAAIVAEESPPTFANTVEALERSGEMLDRVASVFFAMKSSMNNERMEVIAKDVAPKLSQHGDEILLNEPLFRRIEALWAKRDQLDLEPEQRRLLDETRKRFVRGGANLPADKKERLKAINKTLALLSLSFAEHVLKEENRFELVIGDRADLAGLPEGVIAAAEEAAAERGHEGKWVFTLHKPSMIPFLQYSPRRDLREKIYKAYLERGNHGDELDNKQILAEMAALRVERARLLGYPTHAAFVLEEAMAKEPAKVYELLRSSGHRPWSGRRPRPPRCRG